MVNVIDKLAWVRVENNRVLSTRSRGKDKYFIPGGKREGDENDWEALQREVREELNVDLVPNSFEFAGVFEAQAHGKAEGTVVRMSCYRADYVGTLMPGSEIEQVVWLDYSGRERSSAVDKLIFDWLKERGEL